MRIGVLGPIAWRIPPRAYGGWEQVAGNLADGLVARGHDVTLFATADSLTTARLSSVVDRPLSEDPGLGRHAREHEAMHVASALARAAEFDVLHNHAGCFPVCAAPLVATPVLTTLHGSAAEEGSRLIYRRHRDLPYVSITDAERRLCPELSYVATVHNGIAVDRFPFCDRAGGYLLCIGRMSPDKGIHLAIPAAARAGMLLVLAGIVPEENAAYFDARIRPHLADGAVEFIGPVTHAEKGPLMAGAAASLHLVTYEEAFGLTITESLACGTPVIATRRGSIPELLRHGATGFIVDDVEEVAGLVARLGEIDRRACRIEAETRFDVARMVAGYERCYRGLLARDVAEPA
ncbi:MAG: glycosyltransferase family 4 protein [Egibacteraceae bacterium]